MSNSKKHYGIIKKIKGWGIENSLKVFEFGDKCCRESMFLAAKTGLPFETVNNPRQANILLIQGVVTPLLLKKIINIYNEMPSPKITVVSGSCAATGGPYQGPNTIDDLERHISVDYYLTGCPPGKNAIKQMTEDLKEIILKKV